MDWQTFSKREGEQISYQVLKGILDKKTDYQHLEVVDTIPFGRCLFLDGKIQSAEADEFLYHESLTHPESRSRPENGRSGLESLWV